MNKDYLKTVGKIWSQKELQSDIVIDDRLTETVDAVTSYLTQSVP